MQHILLLLLSSLLISGCSALSSPTRSEMPLDTVIIEGRDIKLGDSLSSILDQEFTVAEEGVPVDLASYIQSGASDFVELQIGNDSAKFIFRNLMDYPVKLGDCTFVSLSYSIGGTYGWDITFAHNLTPELTAEKHMPFVEDKEDERWFSYYEDDVKLAYKVDKDKLCTIKLEYTGVEFEREPSEVTQNNQLVIDGMLFELGMSIEDIECLGFSLDTIFSEQWHKGDMTVYLLFEADALYSVEVRLTPGNLPYKIDLPKGMTEATRRESIPGVYRSVEGSPNLYCYRDGDLVIEVEYTDVDEVYRISLYDESLFEIGY